MKQHMMKCHDIPMNETFQQALLASDPSVIYLLPALVTAGSLLLYLLFSCDVERHRRKYSLKLSDTTGINEYFDRVYRIRVNTLEQLIYFLPSLWMFSVYLNMPEKGAIIGSLWIFGRLLYAVEYYNSPEKRPFGLLLCVAATTVLLLGGFYGVILKIPTLGLWGNLIGM